MPQEGTGMAVRRGVQFLATDIWDTPDDGKRYEVIDGELYVTPPPKWGHQRGITKLLVFIANYIYPRKLGEVVPAPTGLVLDDHNGLDPDLIYISSARAGIITE